MKYIIFDLDGTLSRTDKFMIPSIELAMEKMNIPVWTEDAIRCTIGEPVEVTNLKFFGQSNIVKKQEQELWYMYQMIIHQLVNMQIISSSVLQKMIACVKQFIHI